MTTCGHIGALMVGGRVVGQLRCDLDAGHAEGPVPRLITEPGVWPAVYQLNITPHAVTLTWNDEGEIPELDLFDPRETFDVDVPVEEAPPVPAGLCGFAIGDSGQCVYLPHPLGTPHSWAPPLPKQRPGETLLAAERREWRERK